MALVIPPNTSKSLQFEVKEEYTAVHLGSGSVSVLSTPSMILFMEKASGTLAQEHLPSDYTTVGTIVNIAHLKAVKQGGIVTAVSKLRIQEDRKLTFDVKVLHNDEIIGQGIHERFIVNEKRFLEKINQL